MISRILATVLLTLIGTYSFSSAQSQEDLIPLSGATQGGGGGWVQLVHRSNGVLVFQAEFYPSGNNASIMRYWDNLDGSGPAARSEFAFGVPGIPDLNQAVALSQFVHARVVDGETRPDSWFGYGCDMAAEPAVRSCGSKGACCDLQDKCYESNRCNETSWFGVQGDACNRCNGEALLCFMLSSQQPGESACCSANVCGNP